MSPEEFTLAVRPTVLGTKSYNKIFCIGFNKTGTTTLERVLKLYGFNLPNQQEQEIILTKSTFSASYSSLQQFCSAFDAFQDMPFSQGSTYVAADALFPNSKFILTERDPELWYDSLTRFHKKVFGLDELTGMTEDDVINKMNYLYPGYVHFVNRFQVVSFNGGEALYDWSKLYDKDHCINLYETRNNEIKKYFLEAQEKLLVLDITKEKTTESICEFLGIRSNLAIDMPHLNKT